MIARIGCCTHEDLDNVLHDRLAPDATDALVEHVGACEICHRRLASMAADESWWDDSRDILSSLNDVPSETTESIDKRFVPTQLDHYQIESVIGFGGMATVYRALDTELNRPVAIKLLHAHLNASGNSRQRFVREAQSAAAITHPNVIPIYGVRSIDGQSFLAMPLVTGGSLQQRIDREGPLPVDDVLRIGLQIAEGLAAAHAHGVIHRDVKPANILLEDGSRRVLLSDFGLARTLDDASLTQSGMIAGTPAFMSPEQARGEQIDFRSDVYSLGSVLFTMATGHTPFHSSSTLKLLRSVGSEPFPSVHRYQEQLPVWLDNLIARMTTSDPADRIPTASETAELMRRCLAYVSNPQLHALPLEVKQVPSNKLPTANRRTKRFYKFVALAKWPAVTTAILLSFAALAFALNWPSWKTSVQNPLRNQGINTHMRPSQSVGNQSFDIPNTGIAVMNRSEQKKLEPTELNPLDWDDGLDPTLQQISEALDQLLEK